MVDGVIEFFYILADFLIVLSIVVRRLLMFPTLILDLSISLFISIGFVAYNVQVFCFVHALLKLIFIFGG